MGLPRNLYMAVQEAHDPGIGNLRTGKDAAFSLPIMAQRAVAYVDH
jgi:hypothetical protein